MLHFGYNFGYLSDLMFHLEMESAYAEQFQYLKFFSGAAVLFTLATLTKSAVRFVLGLIMSFLLFEDTMGYHEEFYLIGQQIVVLQPIGPFTEVHLWEMIYGFSVGGLLLGSVLWLILRTKNRALAYRAELILLSIALLGSCGVLIDSLHGIMQNSENQGVTIYLESIMGIAEDWGEMIFASLTLVFVADDAYKYRESQNSQIWPAPGDSQP